MNLPTRTELADLAKQAGQLTLNYFRNNVSRSEKPDNKGLVTQADLASEAFIKGIIAQKFPDHHVLAEESGLSSAYKPGEILWVIDPLDGTNNFAHGHSYYCVSIAVGQIRQDGYLEELLCAVYHPIEDCVFSAEKNKGAWRNQLKLQKLETVAANKAFLATGFSSNKGDQLSKCLKTVSALQHQCMAVRINGAAALDMAWTAAGFFHGFFEHPLSPWDFAGGNLLLKEVGAKVTNFQGDTFVTLRDEGIVAAHPELHSWLLNEVQQHFVR